MDAPAPASHLGRAHDRLGLPIPTLDEHIGPASAYQLERRVFFEPGDQLNGFQGGDDGEAVGQAIDRTVVPLAQTFGRRVAVDRHQEHRAERTRLGEVGRVPAVENIEYTVRE